MICKPGQSVGIIGGALDPIHIGHVELLNAVSGFFDRTVLMPCYSHTHDKKMASGHHRITMCQTASAPSLVSGFEIENEIEGGTLVVLQHLKFKFPGTSFTWIIGQDNADSINKWLNWEKLINSFPFFVVPRKGYPLNNDENVWYANPPHYYAKQITNISINSSTKVREDIRNNVWSGNVPEGINPYVYKYIRENKLYLYR